MSKMSFKVLAVLTLLVSMTVLPWPKSAAQPQQGEGDPAVLAKMQQINLQLRAMGLRIAVEEINFITIGNGRPAQPYPSNR